MQYKELKVKLTGTDDLLGSTPMDKELFSNYVKSKCKTDAERQRSEEDVENIIEDDEKGVTGFFRNSKDHIILRGYQVKGFLKEGAVVLKDQLSLASAKSKFDNLVFVLERDIEVKRDGKPLDKADGFLERPLRGETAQGPRVFLAKSEVINAGWTLEFTIRILENKKTAKSVSITPDLVKQVLDYGALKGLLQWRNAGYGTFTYEILEEK